MLSYIKKIILNQKQNIIKRRFPGVNIALHPDMPNPSINKMVELARTVTKVNSLEPKISPLSDSQLKQKSEEFREHILKKYKELEHELNELREAMLLAAISEEKEKIKRVLANKINTKGELVVVSQEARTQRQNRELAIEKLNYLVRTALIPKKKRKPTKPTKASKERRLVSKKRLSEKKKWRSGRVGLA